MARTPQDVRLFFEALTGGRAHAEPATRDRGLPGPAPAPAHARHPAGVRRTPPRPSTRSRSPFEEAERIYPAFVADPVGRGGARPRGHVPRPPGRVQRGRRGAHRARRATVTLEEYTEAIATRERIRAGFARVFAAADLLLTPIHALPPEPRGDRRAELPRRGPALHRPAGPRRPAVGGRAGRLRRARPAGRRPAHRPRPQRGPRARRRRGAVQRDSIGEGGIRVDPVTCGIRIPT